MAASPGDAQPVLDLIGRRAWELCDANDVGVYRFDGTLIHLASVYSHHLSEDVLEAFRASFPMPPSPERSFGRVILSGEIDHVRNFDYLTVVSARGRVLGIKSTLHLPLHRDGKTIGAIGLNAVAQEVFQMPRWNC